MIKNSELQQQIAAHRVKHSIIGTSKSDPRHQPSIFLSPTEAAAVDIGSVYEAAVEGLQTLAQYDFRFEYFMSNIFHATSVELQRDLKTPQENAELDKELSRLLFLLSIYAFDTSSHLVIEYLIRRYKIHDMNSDTLITAMIVAHDTKVFARIVQLCNTSHNCWSFLVGVQFGSSLSHSAIKKRALKDSTVYDKICHFVLSTLQSCAVESSSEFSTVTWQGVDRILAFFTVLTIDMASDTSLSEAHIRSLYPLLLDCLHVPSSTNSQIRSFSLQKRRSCCILIMQICSKTILSPALLKEISLSLVNSFMSIPLETGITGEEILLALAKLAELNALTIGSKLLYSLFRDISAEDNLQSRFFANLELLCSSGSVNVTPLSHSITTGLLTKFIELLTSSIPTDNGSMEKVLLLKLEQKIHTIGQALLNTMKTSIDIETLKKSILVNIFAVITSNVPTNAVALGYVTKIVEFFSQRFPFLLDSIVSEVMAKETDENAECLRSFLKSVFSDRDDDFHVPDKKGLSLLLALHSPIVEVRLEALKSLVKKSTVKEESIAGIVEAVCQSLSDSNRNICQTAWSHKLLSKIVRHINLKSFISVVQNAIVHWSEVASSRNFDEGCVVLKSIIKSVSHSSVLNAILPIEVEELRNEFFDWIYTTLFSLSHGFVRFNYQKGNNAMSVDDVAAFESLESEAFKCIISLDHASSPYSKLFQAIRSEAIEKHSPSSRISDSLKRMFEHEREITATFIVAAIRRSIQNAIDANNISFLLPTFRLLSELAVSTQSIADKVAFKEDLQRFCVQNLLPVLFHSAKLKANDALLDIIGKCLQSLVASLTSLSSETKEENGGSGQLMQILSSVCSDQVVANDKSSVALVALLAVLSSISQVYAQLVTVTLESLFGPRKYEILMRLYISGTKSLSFGDGVDLSPLDYSRLASVSVSTIASYLKADIAASSPILIVALPVALTSCEDSSEAIRKSGLSLVGVLNQILVGPAFSFSFSKKDMQQLSTFGITKKDLPSWKKAFAELCKTVVDRALVIQMESQRAVYIDSDEDKGKGLSVATAVAFLAALFSTRAQAITCALLRPIVGRCSVDNIWRFYDGLLMEVEKSTSSSSLLMNMMISIITEAPIGDYETKKSVVARLSNVIYSPTAEPCGEFRQLILVKISEGMFANFPPDLIQPLYDASRSCLQNSFVSNELLSAVRVLSQSLPLSTMVESLRQGCVAFTTSAAPTLSSNNIMSMNPNDDDDGDDEKELTLAAGLTKDVQRLNALLESTVPSIRAANVVHPDISEAACRIEDLSTLAVQLFDSLKILCHPVLQAVFMIEYCKTLILESLSFCFQFGGLDLFIPIRVTEDVQGNSHKKGKSKAKMATHTSQEFNYYHEGRVSSDINQLVVVLKSARFNQLRNAVLDLLAVIMNFKVGLIASVISSLAGILADTTKGSISTEDQLLLKKILKTCLDFAGSQGGEPVMQAVFESFFSGFSGFSSSKSRLLLQIFQTVFSDASASIFSLMVSHLIALAITSFNESTGDDKLTLVSASEMPIPDLNKLILSKTAQRKARRVGSNSTSTNLFHLAISSLIVTESNSALNIVKVLTKALSSGAKLTQIAIPSAFSEEIQLDNSSESNEVDVKKLLCYSQQSFRETIPLSGNAAVLAIYHFHFVVQVLQDSRFHDYLVDTSDDELQQQYLQFADRLMQMLAALSGTENMVGPSVHATSLELPVGGEIVTVSVSTFGQIVLELCNDCIVSLQQLVDLPSFISILLELLGHDSTAVRQKAKRLLIELSMSLRSMIDQSLPNIVDTAVTVDSRASYSIGFIQSAFMCVDVLARNLGVSFDWSEELSQTLSDIVRWSSELMQLYSKRTSEEDSVDKDQHVAECMKLLGSCFLCGGTTCGVLGPRSLSNLAAFMNNLLTVMESQLVPECKQESSSSMVVLRAQSLLLRSLLSSATALIIQLPNFFHPYLQRTLSAALQVLAISSDIQHQRNFPEADLLVHDLDRLLKAVASKIPPRLAIPTLLEATPTILAIGSQAVDTTFKFSCSKRYVDMLKELWQNLDRSAVIANMKDLGILATLLLDYRSVYGDQSTDMDMVDKAVATALLQLCLKLTESELRHLLLRLIEWRDAPVTMNDSVDAWRSHSRSVSFYSLILELVATLKGIFLPSMTLVWSHAAISLSSLQQNVALWMNRVDGGEDSGDGKKAKKGKKRKQADLLEQQILLIPREIVEIRILCGNVAASIQECCKNDSDGFITEQLYEEMMPALVQVALERNAFPSDSEYSSFCDSLVIPSICALAVSVGNDLLWKSMNHSMLMATRDKRICVRVIAVKAIHRLFAEIGEEYLILLPECMSFFSELMEDDSQEVVDATIQAMQFIEELSGEKLDSYL
eukprot:gene25488-34039_t